MIQRPLVVVPTYDEADNIVELIDRVLAAAPGVNILVVDDNSPDGTAGIVGVRREHDCRIHLLQRPGKAGLGAAYRAGFRWALHRGYDAVVQIDADLPHPPERIPALLEALRNHDVVVGSRYVPGGSVVDWARSRRWISRLGNLYVATMLSLPVKDATAGFKAFRAEALAEIGVLGSVSNGYCFQVENTWQASRHGLRVAELPITFTDRTHGASKMSSAVVVEALVRVLGWRLRDRRIQLSTTTLLSRRRGT